MKGRAAPLPSRPSPLTRPAPRRISDAARVRRARPCFPSRCQAETWNAEVFAVRERSGVNPLLRRDVRINRSTPRSMNECLD
eukprot:3614794-Pyramimonas_sp.AAC.1